MAVGVLEDCRDDAADPPAQDANRPLFPAIRPSGHALPPAARRGFNLHRIARDSRWGECPDDGETLAALRLRKRTRSRMRFA